MLSRIKKNDKIVVLSGKDKDRQGVVLEIDAKKERVMVKGLGMITKHAKARRQGDVAGIKQQEGYIKLSSVMPFCDGCKKPCRVVVKQTENGAKTRACSRCKETV